MAKSGNAIRSGAGLSKSAITARPSGVQMRIPTPAKKSPQPAIPYPVTKK